MHRTLFHALIALAVFTFSQRALAQSDGGSAFVRPENSPSSASSGTPCDLQFPSKLPVRCWATQKLIVLPIDKSLRSYGYQMIDGGRGPYGHPTYEELAGKTVSVVSVEWQTNDIMPDLSNWLVTFKEDSSGNVYSAKTVILPGETPDDAVLDNFALLRDLQAARDRYLGKKFWMAAGWLPALGENGAISFSSVVNYKKFVPITVTDVLASGDATQPVRIVLKNDAGLEGYFDIAASTTNRSREEVGSVGDIAIARVLASSDPKLVHKWPANVWDAIENQRVFIGMTSEQARLSRGDPQTVNRTIVAGRVHEQWVYDGGSYLYFDNGRLGAVQN